MCPQHCVLVCHHLNKNEPFRRFIDLFPVLTSPDGFPATSEGENFSRREGRSVNFVFAMFICPWRLKFNT